MSLDFSSTMTSVSRAVAAQSLLLNSTSIALTAWRKRLANRRAKRRQRKLTHGGGGSSSTSAAAVAAVFSPTTSHLLVLGIISNPRTPHTREWIRSTYLSSVPANSESDPSGALIRFVMGQRGLNKDDRRKLHLEQAAHHDLAFIDASDFGERGGIFSCIDKLFAWFPHAVHAYPGAIFYAKADDDSYVDVRRLLGLLSPLRSFRNVYLGYVQYDSFLADEWKHCGWAAGPIAAAHAHAHGCPRDAGPAYGPFPFVVGALTVMGADLASWMRSSAELATLVRDGRASQSGPKHWDCGYSDVTLGYAFARSNRSVSLVSVRDAMRDATYGAMNAHRFVVSHHLRKRPQFEKAHAEALAQAKWTTRAPACSAWAETTRVGLPWSEEATPEAKRTAKQKRRDEPAPAEFRRAMRSFPGCQKWQLCEVGPED